MNIKTLLLLSPVLLACENKSEERIFPNFPPEDTVKVEFDFDAFEKCTMGLIDWQLNNWNRRYPISSCGYESPEGFSIYVDSDTNRYYEEHCHGIFGDFYIFFPSGKLKNRGFFFSKDGKSSEFDVGNRYEFDEQGKLIDVYNTDENYPFNTDSMIVFLKNKGLNVWDKSVRRISRREATVERALENIPVWDGPGEYIWELEEGTGEYIWEFMYVLPGTEELRGVTLSAKDGTVLVDTVVIDKHPFCYEY